LEQSGSREIAITGNASTRKYLRLFNEAMAALEKQFGTWRVAWGDVNRLQRLDESKAEKFRDDRPSLPVPGISGNDGAVFTFYSTGEEGQKRRYGVAGGQLH
jgi:acyl-homoserine lactone acylase PvdQ